MSLIGKLVEKGELIPRPRREGALSRDEVIGLRGLREQRERDRAEQQERDRAARRHQLQGRAVPPDIEHLWLRTAQVAELLGISVVSVNKRCRADRLPYVEKAGRRWIRMDRLELVERALHAQEERCP